MPSHPQTSKQIGCDCIVLNVERLKKNWKKKNGKKLKKKNQFFFFQFFFPFFFHFFFFSFFLYMDVPNIELKTCNITFKKGMYFISIPLTLWSAKIVTKKWNLSVHSDQLPTTVQIPEDSPKNTLQYYIMKETLIKYIVHLMYIAQRYFVK